MNELGRELMKQLPSHLNEFLDTLSNQEINELNKIDKHLVAKIYQAGSKFSIEIGAKLLRESK